MSAWDSLHAPYPIHTGRELEFMLNRGKPLAHFSDAYPPDPNDEIIPRRAFAPHVSAGTFEMRELVTLLSEPLPASPLVRGSIHVFYARPAEEWRIDAYIAMLAAADRAGWSDDFERLEGTLLGYTDAENDAHIERMLRSPQARHFPWLRTLLAKRGT